MLVHIKEIIPKAMKKGYAVPAFNTFNLETTLAIVRGATNKKSPLIIQISETTIGYAGLKPITHIMETVAKNEAVKIPVALHLDHGKSFHSVAECIQAGFSSIHLDASELPYDENVVLTKQGSEYAHKHGVWAQGELGTILGQKNLIQGDLEEDLTKYMTDPDEAEKFIRETDIDTLAPSVGAMHGLFKGKEKINFDILKALREKVKLPLVLHGASGVSDEDVKETIKYGVSVINIDTRLRQAFTQTLRETLMTNVHEIDPRKILGPCIDTIQKAVEEKIEIFGCKNKC